MPAALSHTPSPSSVTLAGSFQTSLGCAGIWDPSCAATHLTAAGTTAWRGSFNVPAGAWEYKVALNDGWSESYGNNGSNVVLNLASPQTVTFYYSHATHWVTSNAQPGVAIATAVGDFQSELGCTGDWQPNCLQSWLEDSDGDGTYTFSTSAIPAGSYQAKVTINESWTENYGAGGVPGGANIAFTVPANGTRMDFSYDGASHVMTVSARHGAHDDNISWSDLRHDSRDVAYRTPGGPLTAGTPVTVRLRTLAGDLTGAEVRVWNDRTDTQSLVTMGLVATDGNYDWWEATLGPGSDPTILWYRFIAHDGSAVAYYEDDASRDGGAGETLGTSADRGWQITEYDPAFTTPDWAKNGIVYQIFPDRFRDGNAANDTPAGSFFYGAASTIRRSAQSNWNATICDPRDSAGPCSGKYSDNFYGGDLQGVIDKLPYLSGLGVSVLYLNPIFASPSNHRYDTSDYSTIDPSLGDNATFQSLASQAHALGMKVVLDGVFNHTSSDSKYFDRYHRYASSNGACEDIASPFRAWYYFQPAGSPGSGVCAGDTFYTSWFGYDSLPKLNSSNAAARQLVWDDANSIARYWLAQGADGWRLDVGGDLDPGLTNDPSNNYWEGFRSSVRAQKSDAWIVGEEWGLATPWTLGGEWDATMNYQFSSAILGFWRDEAFIDNDHDAGSSAGTLAPLTPSKLDARLHNLAERYPPQSLQAMMNLLDSHDTNRALFMLDHRADENDPSIYRNPAYDWSDAIARLKGAVLLQMTLPGAPTIYYGDEVGLVGPPAYANGKWEDDPYNRQPFPWSDETGTAFYPHLQSGGAGEGLRSWYQLLTSTRNAHPALRTGSFDTLLADDANDVYAYGRKAAGGTDAAIVMINRGGSTQTITVNVAGYLPHGAQFVDVLNSNAPYTVTGGVLSVSNVAARGGALLVRASALAAPPAAVTDLAVSSVGSSTVGLSWTATSGADGYDVYRSLLHGGGYTLDGSTSSASYTANGLTPSQTYYFVVVARKSTTGLASGNSNEVSARPQHDLSNSGTSWFNLQWPPSITHTISTTTRTDSIYGQLWINGATDAPGPTAGILAQVGYGPSGSAPQSGWTWSDMTFNAQAGNNDEFVGSLLPDAVGSFDYAVRYSADGGLQWWYADLNGPQRGGTLSNPGHLTVNASADTTAPATPAGLAVTATSASAISLTWAPNTDADLAGYEVYREAVATPGYTKIASTTATSYSDTAVTAGTSYNYYVKAFDTSFNRSSASSSVLATAQLRYVDITFNVTLPAFTPAGTVYIVGNIPELGGWNPAAEATTGSGATRTFVLHVLDGTAFEYKFTRGTWETVEKIADGSGEITHQWTADYGMAGTQTVNVTVQNWRDPIVTAHTPAANATDVPTSATITVTWSQAMPANTSFTVSSPGGSVAGTFAHDGGTNTTTFTPAQALANGTVYTVAVAGAQSSAMNMQQVPATWTFTTVCNVPTPTITAGGAVTFCDGGSVTLTSSSANGNQWSKNGTPISGANASTLVVTSSGDYTVAVTAGNCVSAPSNTIQVTANPVPVAPTITPDGPTTFCEGGSVTLTSSAANGNQWYRDGQLLAGETGQTILATTAGVYRVATTANGCTSNLAPGVSVVVLPKPDATITAPSTMYSGAAAVASVNVSCIGATFAWSISGGTLKSGQGTPRVAFTAGAAGTLTLTITVTNSHGCSDTKTADVAVQLAPFGASPYFRATANGTSADLQWAAVASAHHYDVYRSTDNAQWTKVQSTAAPSALDGGLLAGRSYLYRVLAVNADGREAPFSAIDFATTVSLADVHACGTLVRAVHVLELRQAINLARSSVGLSAFSFTDPSLTAGSVIRAVHVTELRSALAPALTAIGRSASYTDPTITPGVTTVKAAHLDELSALLR